MRRGWVWGIGMVLSAAALVIALSFCDVVGRSPEGSETGDDASIMEGEAASADFALYSADPVPLWNGMQDDVGKAITARTGVTLDLHYSQGDEIQEINLMVSADEYPDLIYPKGQGKTLVDAGAMLDLTDLIDRYAPNIKRMLGGDLSHLRWSNDNPGIYFIPTISAISTPGSETGGDAQGTFMLQHAVVKELGFPRLRTLQDYENAIAAYYRRHPTVNGQPTIPLSLNSDEWNIIFTVLNPSFAATGVSDDGEYVVDPKTYEAKLNYRRPEAKEYFRWLNHMNDIGLLDPESFVQKSSQWLEKIASGRVLGLIGATWQFNDARFALIKNGMAERTYGIYDISLDADMKTPFNQKIAFSGGWGVGITKSCKDPVRAIRFLDYLSSDEGQVLNNWGVEGKQYVVKNGKRVIPDEVRNRKVNDASAFYKESGIGEYGWSLKYAEGVKDPNGDYFSPVLPDQIASEYTDVEREVLAAYGKKIWRDMFPPSSEFPVKEWGYGWDIPIPVDSDANVIAEKIRKNVTWKRIPEIILAPPSQFDWRWDEFIAELDSNGAVRMEQAFTKYVKARLKLWSTP